MGATFVRLTNDDLKNKLEIKQFGLRDSFIAARDQIIEQYNHRQQNSINTCSTDKLEPITISSSQTIPEINKYLLPCSPVIASNDVFIEVPPIMSPSCNSKSPIGQYVNNNNITNNITSSDILSAYNASSTHLYTDLCDIVCSGFCRNILSQCTNIRTLARTQWNIINAIVFEFYFLYEHHIANFGHDLWKTLVVIRTETIQNGNTVIRGFTGNALINHIKQQKTLQKYIKHKAYHRHHDNLQINLKSLCAALIRHSFIRLAAVTDHNDNLLQLLHESDKDNFSKNIFVDSVHYLYQFEKAKHRMFIKSDEPDRGAWSKGCAVEIYSSTNNGWCNGTIIDICGDAVTIQYGAVQQMRKTVDRYQDNEIKSTAHFILVRKQWTKDTELEVYSNRHKKWYLGKVTEVILRSEGDAGQPWDILSVYYQNHEGQEYNKYVSRWSCDLREASLFNTTSSQEHMPYKKGTHLFVFSHSKGQWLRGIVIKVMKEQKIINVRYGDAFEKMMEWNSEDLWNGVGRPPH